ncbi:MAG: hypothetical protein GQ540_02605 [Lutibacter sp.]|uniref:glycerophosphoryl diester phosphodiesterase membrane domain-containing protein n=1 Tax=Lutibacter sp. TaxID=1925666 RepID=UPI0019DF51F8|nr:glycerophosphoryl diester phosphodiesterase membrane domain-containing protein [Lutibacter sp.]NOR27399.1 hypothetical protein [Lutibacter sp.]
MSNFIEFKKERDLGAIITDTFTFIRENWKDYFLTVFKIIGPVLLIGAALLVFAMISYSGAIKGIVNVNQSAPDPSAVFGNMFGMFGWLLAMFAVFGIVYTLLAEVSLYYVQSYIKNNGVANFDEVKEKTYANVWKFLGLGMLAILMMIVAYVLCFFPVIYISIVLTLAMPIMVFENKSVGDTISHCFTLIKNEWWNTFGVVFVIGLLVAMLGFIFSIPSLIYQLVSMGTSMMNEDPTAILGILEDPIYLVLNLLAYLGKFLFYSVTLVSSAFIYFDLNEQKNFTGTFEKIENIGND